MWIKGISPHLQEPHCFYFAFVIEQCHCQMLDNNDNHEVTNSQRLPTVNSKRYIWVCLHSCHQRQKPHANLVISSVTKDCCGQNHGIVVFSIVNEHNSLGSVCFCALLQATIIGVNSIDTAEPMD